MEFDMNELQKEYERNLIEQKERELDKHTNDIKYFLNYCNDMGIEKSEITIDYIPTIGVIAQSENILLKLNKKLKQDKEGLFDFKILSSEYAIKKENTGYFYHNKYIAMLSPFFRRGHNLLNIWSPGLLDMLFGYNFTNYDLKILLDLDNIRINIDDTVYMEEDFWYGARYKENIPDIIDGCVKLIPPADIKKELIDFLFQNTHSFDVSWKSNRELKTFEALEFKTDAHTVNINERVVHPAKYFHSEYNLSKDMFQHLDGAVQLFSYEDYHSRRDSDFNNIWKDNKHTKADYIKLFKLNGDIEKRLWENITCMFFRGNPLVHEYFTGELPVEMKANIEKLRSNG